jgi:hypothetical protein
VAAFGMSKSTAIGLTGPANHRVLSRSLLTVRGVQSLHCYRRILGRNALPLPVRHFDPRVSPL